MKLSIHATVESLPLVRIKKTIKNHFTEAYYFFEKYLLWIFLNERNIILQIELKFRCFPPQSLFSLPGGKYCHRRPVPAVHAFLKVYRILFSVFLILFCVSVFNLPCNILYIIILPLALLSSICSFSYT